jgi:hypothetical protein
MIENQNSDKYLQRATIEHRVVQFLHCCFGTVHGCELNVRESHSTTVLSTFQTNLISIESLNTNSETRIEEK